MFRKILIGFDGSEESWKALRWGMTLCKLAPECELWALSVEERLPRMPEIIDELAEEMIDCLTAPVKRVAAPNTPAPFAPPMEHFYVPSVERIAEAVRQVMC